MSILDTLAPEVTEEPQEEIQVQPESQAEAQPEPEAKPEPEPAQEPARKMVPLEALHESRIKEREARARAEQIERDAAERFARLEERLNALSKAPIPTFEQDPAAHLKHQVESVRGEFEPVRQTLEQLTRQQQEQQAIAQLAQATAMSEAEFAKATPDYFPAVEHLKKVLDSNLQVLGVTDPATRAQEIHKQMLQLSHGSISQGRNPAEVAYQMAKNYGFAGAPKAAPSIETLQKGQKATPSMPSGGKPEANLSLTALEQMDDDEFNKLIDDPKAWRKLISQ